jgi:hypothetical protein
MANRLALLLSLRYYVLAGARKPAGAARQAGPGWHTEGHTRGAHQPPWLEAFMKRDGKQAEEKRRRGRRSAKAHWLLASVTKRQSQLHRELALLLDKEAEAHEAMGRWDRGAATAGAAPTGAPGAAAAHPADLDAPEPAGADLDAAGGKSTDFKAAGVARIEARAHRDLALRADARTLWHKTVTALLLRQGMPEGSRVRPPRTDDAGAGDDRD